MSASRIKPGPLVSIVIALLVAVYCLLHSWRPETRLPFMAGSRRMFSTEPGSPGYFQTAYTVNRPLRVIGEIARAEATLRGYVGGWSRDGKFLTMDLSRARTMNAVSVTVSRGKVTGKHFSVDGDFVDSDSDPNWSTIEVTEVDPMPMWLRDLVRWPE